MMDLLCNIFNLIEKNIMRQPYFIKDAYEDPFSISTEISNNNLHYCHLLLDGECEVAI